MSTVEQDYNTIASVCNVFNKTLPLATNTQQLKEELFGPGMGQLVPDSILIPQGPNGSAASLAVVCTTKAVSMSQQDMNNPSLIQDFYMITHELALTPNVVAAGIWLGMQSYHIEVIPIDGEGPLAYPNSGSLMTKSQPGTTESLTNYSDSMSQSVSGNVGFFGGTPTGGVSGGITTSHTVSYQVADVMVRNQPTEGGVSILFAIAPGAAVGLSGFQPTLQHLNQGKDNASFMPNERSNLAQDAGSAPCVWFLLRITAAMWWKQKSSGTLKFGSKPMAVFETPFQVRMPPIPGFPAA